MLHEMVGLLVELPRNVRGAAEEAIEYAAELIDSVRRLEQHVSAIAGTLGTVGKEIHELRVLSQSQDERVARIEGALTAFDRRLTTIETLVARLLRDVDEATKRLPHKEKGPLGKARDVLTGDSRR
jgi:DNA anti-recombination protein RmuC